MKNPAHLTSWNLQLFGIFYLKNNLNDSLIIKIVAGYFSVD